MTQDLPERRVGAEPGAIAARREEHRRGRRGPVQRGHAGYTGGRDGLPESSNNQKKRGGRHVASRCPWCPCALAAPLGPSSPSLHGKSSRDRARADWRGQTKRRRKQENGAKRKGPMRTPVGGWNRQSGQPNHDGLLARPAFPCRPGVWEKQG